MGPAVADLSQTLTGPIIRLEPFDEHHADGLWEAAQASDWTWMPVDAGSSPEAFRRWLDWSRRADSVPLVTVSAKSGRVLGGTHYHEIRPEHRRLEIGGTWLAKDVWNSGANVEAKLLQLTLVFSLGFQRVEFKTHPENVRSRRALEALPARFEGILRKHLLVRDGQPRDSAYYSVIDEEWPRVRANLERRLASAG